MARVILLNGGSSSGKSGVARCLQAILPDPWLAIGVDDLVDAMPAALNGSTAGIEFAADGAVNVGDWFRRLERSWMAGMAGIVRAGTGLLIDDVFLGGAISQQRWRDALAGLDVLWVGVRCPAEVAAEREVARGDRAIGMALSQAERVHQGVRYDLEVDTSQASAMQCARVIAARLG